MVRAGRRSDVVRAALALLLFVVAAACGSSDFVARPDAIPLSPSSEAGGGDDGATGDASSGGDTGTIAETGVDADTGAPDGAKPPTPPNILVVISDDVGLDASVCHAIGADPGRTPRIKALCDTGVVFDNAWAAPVCAPTRAAMLTGRHNFRNGVGNVTGSTALPLSERVLPRALVDGNPSYVAAAFGKWHLSGASNGGANHPNAVGFARFAGSLPNQVPNFFNWSRTVDGVSANTTTYATTANVDDAVGWIQAQTKPWLVWLAFNAPHTPFHVPPAGLHTYAGLSGPPFPNPPIDHFHAALEALDTELGRLLDSLTPAARAKTWIIYLGDNGTTAEVAQAPFAASKGSLYQGGVQVPMMINGPGVVAGGRHVDALVHVLDVFGTVLDLAEVDKAKALPPGGNTVDSVSILPYAKNAAQPPLRTHVMTEVFGGVPFNGGRLGKTIRDERYKLIRFEDGGVELYDLVDDPYEAIELISAGPLSVDADNHFASLGAALDALLASP